ncbi:hypothetical protein [Bacillus sp. KH172YL63]|uniref:hypothetical protein n=1 Tax=Bacillus sp. KH172YL63 TaxID=2709784 RepID=UPI0013E5189B|nr:hypothetical protein [Bacillus sp. KH172YL63]BCB02171.1 hypothetical protein KH172YL63_03040 [Bacillus sp. KH172YL63]
MDSKKIVIQIKKALILLEDKYKSEPTDMLKMIIKKYREACYILENNKVDRLSKEMISLRGLSRAYLEAYSDYLNPVLDEMNKVEKMIDSTN